jgi:hypothetical protein
MQGKLDPGGRAARMLDFAGAASYEFPAMTMAGCARSDRCGRPLPAPISRPRAERAARLCFSPSALRFDLPSSREG